MLSKGANAPLVHDEQSLGSVRLTASWAPGEGLDVDACALLLDRDGKVRSNDDFVFYNQVEAEDGAVRLLGKTKEDGQAQDRLLVGLQNLPESIAKVLIALSLEAPEGVGFSSVQQVAVTASTPDEQPLLTYSPSGLADETCLVLAELYRRDEGWRFRAIGQGYSAGLAGLATDYGITVDAEVPEDSQEVPAKLSGAEAAAPDVSAESLDATEPHAVALDPPPAQALPIPPAVAAIPGRRTNAVRTKRTQTMAAPVRPLTLADDDS